MSALADIGRTIEVTPCDEVWHKTGEGVCDYVNDYSPFRFSVEGRLEDGQIFYGLFGPVTAGPDRYRGLICSIVVRGDGSDWRISRRCQANFKVGPTKARRNHAFDFRHPEGTIVDGYPVLGRFGLIEAVDEEYPTPSVFRQLAEALWREGGLERLPSQTNNPALGSPLPAPSRSRRAIRNLKPKRRGAPGSGLPGLDVLQKNVSLRLPQRQRDRNRVSHLQ
jgi:hypothetical protein